MFMLYKKVILILILGSISFPITAKKIPYNTYMSPDEVVAQLESDGNRLTTELANTQTQVVSSVNHLEQEIRQLRKEQVELKEEIKNMKQELQRLFRHAGIQPWMSL